MSDPQQPALRERVLGAVVAVFGVLALVAAIRAGTPVYAGVGVAWLASAVVLWTRTGGWLFLGLGLFALGFGLLTTVG